MLKRIEKRIIAHLASFSVWIDSKNITESLKIILPIGNLKFGLPSIYFGNLKSIDGPETYPHKRWK